MRTVGFIGSGSIGGTVARLAVAAGFDVVLSNSRGPETLAGLAGELGSRARAATPAEAAAADLVVVSVPFHAHRQLPVEALAGKVVLDTNNYCTALTIAGDDAQAKRAVTEFLDAIGYDAVDVGPLAESWRVQPGQPAYGPPYGSFSDPTGTPASADTVRAAVADAKR